MLKEYWLSEDDRDDLKRKNTLELNDLCYWSAAGSHGKIQKLEKTFYYWSAAKGFYAEENDSELEFLLIGSKEFQCEKDAVYFVRMRATNLGHKLKINGRNVRESFLFRGDRISYHFSLFHFKKMELHNDFVMNNFSLKEEISTSPINILITGETGTGKGHLARSIFEWRNQKRGLSGRYIHLNLSALSPQLIESELFGHIKGSFTGAMSDRTGAFQQANRGTLFLDEIDSLSIDIQTKLLLFLDEGKIRSVGSEVEKKMEVKLIVASGSCLRKKVELGLMRADFFYRISSGVEIHLKSLREDPQKIKEFCDHFQNEEGVIFSPTLMQFYQNYSWPGNYRQLKEHLKKKKILTPGRYLKFDEWDDHLISAQGLGISNTHHRILKESMDLGSTLIEMKKKYALWSYHLFDGNEKLTSQQLGISKKTLKLLLGDDYLLKAG